MPQIDCAAFLETTEVSCHNGNPIKRNHQTIANPPNRCGNPSTAPVKNPSSKTGPPPSAGWNATAFTRIIRAKTLRIHLRDRVHCYLQDFSTKYAPNQKICVHLRPYPRQSARTPFFPHHPRETPFILYGVISEPPPRRHPKTNPYSSPITSSESQTLSIKNNRIS